MTDPIRAAEAAEAERAALMQFFGSDSDTFASHDVATVLHWRSRLCDFLRAALPGLREAGEPVAWSPAYSTGLRSWTDGKPDADTVAYWALRGTPIAYAYEGAAPPSPAPQPDLDQQLTAAYAEGRKDERAEVIELLKAEAASTRREGEGCRDARYDHMADGIEAAVDALGGIDSATGKPATQELMESLMPWRDQAAAWLRRKADDAEAAAASTGWANPAHTLPDTLHRLAAELDAESEAAPFGLEPWQAPPSPAPQGERAQTTEPAPEAGVVEALRIVAKMRADLTALGGFENELVGVNAGGIRNYIVALEAALAALAAQPQTAPAVVDALRTCVQELRAMRAACGSGLHTDAAIAAGEAALAARPAGQGAPK